MVQLPKGEAAMNDYYSYYRNKAKRRNIDFVLSKEEFIDLVTRNCCYCGCSPYKKYPYVKKYNGFVIVNGVDRKNPYDSYNINNCVPCCGICNMCKQRHTHEEFKNWIVKVYNFYCIDDFE